MRTLGWALVCLLSALSPAVADEEAPAKADEAKALKRFEELAAQIQPLVDEERFDEAVPLGLELLAIQEKTKASLSPELAWNCTLLAAATRNASKYEAALALLELSLPVLEKAHGSGHVRVAGCLARICHHRFHLSRYDGLWPIARRAEAILATLPDGPDVASACSWLGNTLSRLGQYKSARKLLERMVSIHEKDPEAAGVELSYALQGLGGVLYELRQFEAAMAMEQRALAIMEKLKGPEHPSVAYALAGVGISANGRGLYELALSYHQRALAIREKVHGPEHQLVALCLANIGTTLNNLKRYDEAHSALSRALAIREKVFGAKNAYTAWNLHLLAVVLRNQGRYEEARPLIERALRDGAPLVGAEHDYVARGFDNYARILAGLGEHEAAMEASERCVSIFERRMRRDFLVLQGPERFARVAWFRRHGMLDTRLSVAAAGGQTGYDALLRFKGFVARAEAAERRLLRRHGTAANEELSALREAEQALGRISMNRPRGLNQKLRTEWKAKVAEAAAKRERLARALTEDIAPLREGLERLDLRLSDVQSQLGPNEVLVDMLQSSGRYLAWIVPPKGDVVRVDLGDAEAIEDAAEEFATLSASSTIKTLGDPAWLEAGHTLRALAFAPIEKHLGEGVNTLIVAPDGALASVPMAALPAKEKGRFLLDDYTLRFVSMAQDLVPWPDAKATGKGVLLAGDPDYSKAAKVSEDVPLAPPTRDAASLPRALRGRNFLRLPQTRVEVDYVKGLLKQPPVVLLGANATEARVRAEVRGKRAVHLATHGFVWNELKTRKSERKWLGAHAERQLAMGQDPMLLTGLAFAGANPRDGANGDDGILTALEASRLDLDGVELVVLSACETALGRAESGEGVIGLVQGFQMAGAKHVVASLWQVDDEATRRLMERLYEGVLRSEKTLSPAQALRQAALALRDTPSGGARSFSAPRFWAAFVAYGR